MLTFQLQPSSRNTGIVDEESKSNLSLVKYRIYGFTESMVHAQKEGGKKLAIFNIEVAVGPTVHG